MKNKIECLKSVIKIQKAEKWFQTNPEGFKNAQKLPTKESKCRKK